MKKGVELSMNTIIIAALALLIFVILAVIVVNNPPNGNNQITGIIHDLNRTNLTYNTTSTSKPCCYPIECYENITEYEETNCSKTCVYPVACEYEEEMNWKISNESIWMVAAINRTTDINYVFNKNGTEIIDIKSNENYTNYTISINNIHFKMIDCENKNYTCYVER